MDNIYPGINLFSDGSQNVTSSYEGRTDGLDHLRGFVSFEAQFDTSAQDPDRQCHPGTRQIVLKRLRDWVDNPKPKERIFWLYGPAGVGKSAMAQTIAHSYGQLKVAATFFFCRSDDNRNDGKRLFPTLAYQLAFSISEIRDYIAKSLDEHPNLPSAPIETQFNQLLARPFQVLSEGAIQQSAPAVDIVKKYQELAPIIIIDGVDECVDELLQERFLKAIGDAVTDDRFPLRFLIVSRPEAHIEETIRSFQTAILTIDLAELDDTNLDIEKYLVHEFTRIALEQGLDPTWPGPEIINDIAYKSSGLFIYLGVLIRFVGDPDSSAETQLDIVMNLKPQSTAPFATLDQLYLKILRRVPDQDFLMRFLALLIARICISDYRDRDNLYQDDAELMHLPEEELHAGLRRMRAVLKFKPVIDVYHKSFLDFLTDSSRSSNYHMSKRAGTRYYLNLMTQLLIRRAARLTNHGDDHFAPAFGNVINRNPQAIELAVEEWEEILRPLVDYLNKLLVPPKVDSLMNGYCQQCRFFQIAYDIVMHFKSLLGKRDADVEKCLKSLEDIISWGDPGHENFDINFGGVIYGTAAIVGLLMSILPYYR